MHVCMYLLMHVIIQVYTYIHVYTYTHTRIHTNTHSEISALYVCTRMWLYVHACVCVCVCVCICLYIYIYTHTRTYFVLPALTLHTTYTTDTRLGVEDLWLGSVQGFVFRVRGQGLWVGPGSTSNAATSFEPYEKEEFRGLSN